MVPLMKQFINPKTGLLEKEQVLGSDNKPIMIKSKDLIENLDNPRTIKEAIWFGKEYAGTIGEAYGFINATYKRPQCVENTLKTKLSKMIDDRIRNLKASLFMIINQ